MSPNKVLALCKWGATWLLLILNLLYTVKGISAGFPPQHVPYTKKKYQER